MEHSDVGSSTELPLHAGFDFGAIQDVIGKADLNPAELQIPAPSKVPVPHIPPPSHRSESAPLPEVDSPLSTPRVRSSLDLPVTNDYPAAIAGPSSSIDARDDLASSFSRALSLNNLRDERENDMTSLSGKTPTAAGYTQSIPSLSFGSSDGSVWPGQTTSYENSPFGDRSHFNGSGTALRSENPFTLGGTQGGSMYSSPLSGNPFAPQETTGLSFGGMDGSITPTPTSRRDPWDIPSPMFGGGKKSASTLNLNPWQS